MTDGILLVAHGTIAHLDELPAFLAEIRRGRPAPPELVAELERRYTAIGRSPLLDVTRAQAAALSAALGLPAFVGMRLSAPRIAEALQAAWAQGVRRLAVIALAPFSAHVYAAAVDAARAALVQERGDAPTLVHGGAWGDEPDLLEYWRSSIAASTSPGAQVVLSAHSLPRRVIDAGDPYAVTFERSASTLAGLLDRPARVAYQSQGAEAGDWLGPDLPATFDALRAEGAREVLVAPVGFLAEHVETLYDLDLEARDLADARGLCFARVATPGTDPRLVAALAAVARRALDRA